MDDIPIVTSLEHVSSKSAQADMSQTECQR